MIPPEVAAAQRALAQGPQFGSEEQLIAHQVLQRWKEVACDFCDGGVKKVSGVGHYVCQACEGTGRRWVKR